MLPYQPSLVAAALLSSLSFLTVSVNGYSFGAGRCLAGEPSVSSTHLSASNITTGSLTDGALQLTIDGTPLVEGTPFNVTVGVDHTLEVSRPSSFFRGLLFRLATSDLTALAPQGNLQKAMTCSPFAGVTHTEASDKTNAAATLHMNMAVQEVALDVTVVIQNQAVSEYYYTGYIINAVPPPSGPVASSVAPTVSPAVPTLSPVTQTSAPVTNATAPAPSTNTPTTTPKTPKTKAPTTKPTPAPTATPNIVDIVAKQPDLTTLAGVVMASNLSDILEFAGPSTFTLFAPDDAAFAAVNDTVAKLLAPEWIDHLRNLLMFHATFVSGELMAKDLKNEMTLIMNNLELVNVSTDGQTVQLEIAYFPPSTVVTPNLIGSNGVVHKIDRVLLPEFVAFDLYDRLVNDTNSTFHNRTVEANQTNFRYAAEWVKAVGMEEELRNGTYTLLAPYDHAVNALPLAVRELLSDPANGDLLRSVVLNHLIPAVIPESALAGFFTTAEGINISISNDGDATTFIEAGASSANFSGYKYLARNGIVYEITAVLLPSDLSNSPSDIPSDMPSHIPSDTPSDLHSDVPSSTPSAAPVMAGATSAPTRRNIVPTSMPLAMPVAPSPVLVPMPIPAPTPVAAPTSAPVRGPTPVAAIEEPTSSAVMASFQHSLSVIQMMAIAMLTFIL